MSQKISREYKCIACDYTTCKKSDYTKHLSTRKHKLRSNTTENSPIVKDFKCDCGKTYKHQSSLWNHKQKCIIIEPLSEEVSVKNSENDKLAEKDKIIESLLKNQEEMKDLMTEAIEAVKNQPPLTTNIVNNFNLNVYLNETCKDALNLTDFVDSIQVQLKDLENMGKLGYVEGMSNLIITELNNLEKNKRPIHCSDIKREVLYIKDNDIWEKDNSKVERAVKTLEKKNFKQMPKWLQENPQAALAHSEKSTEWHNIIQCSFSQEEDKKIKKVLKNIARATPVRETNNTD